MDQDGWLLDRKTLTGVGGGKRCGMAGVKVNELRLEVAKMWNVE